MTKTRERLASYELPAPMSMCDFCSRASAELALFPCADFQRRVIQRPREKTLIIEGCTCHVQIELEPGDEVVQIENLSGAWAACPPCAALVRAGNQTGLAEEAARSWTDPEPAPPAAFWWGLHQGYWFHRTEEGT